MEYVLSPFINGILKINNINRHDRYFPCLVLSCLVLSCLAMCIRYWFRIVMYIILRSPFSTTLTIRVSYGLLATSRCCFLYAIGFILLYKVNWHDQELKVSTKNKYALIVSQILSNNTMWLLMHTTDHNVWFGLK